MTSYNFNYISRNAYGGKAIFSNLPTLKFDYN